jgi:periplasmic divalent cation tolerance protein
MLFFGVKIMDNLYSIVLTTASNPAEAAKIAQVLLNSKLAACIQINQIKSYYIWQGRINIDDEQQLLIKCQTQDFAKVQDCIKENHSYETPEIIQIPITDGSPEYFKWINESVDRSNLAENNEVNNSRQND